MNVYQIHILSEYKGVEEVSKVNLIFSSKLAVDKWLDINAQEYYDCHKENGVWLKCFYTETCEVVD